MIKKIFNISFRFFKKRPNCRQVLFRLKFCKTICKWISIMQVYILGLSFINELGFLKIYIHIRYLSTYQTIKGLDFSTAWLLCVTYLKSHVMIKISIYNLQIKQNLISLFCRHFSIWYGSMRVIILIEFFPESKLKWFHSLTRSIASFHLLAV